MTQHTNPEGAPIEEGQIYNTEWSKYEIMFIRGKLVGCLCLDEEICEDPTWSTTLDDNFHRLIHDPKRPYFPLPDDQPMRLVKDEEKSRYKIPDCAQKYILFTKPLNDIIGHWECGMHPSGLFQDDFEYCIPRSFEFKDDMLKEKPVEWKVGDGFVRHGTAWVICTIHESCGELEGTCAMVNLSTFDVDVAAIYPPDPDREHKTKAELLQFAATKELGGEVPEEKPVEGDEGYKWCPDCGDGYLISYKGKYHHCTACDFQCSFEHEKELGGELPEQEPEAPEMLELTTEVQDWSQVQAEDALFEIKNTLTTFTYDLQSLVDAVNQIRTKEG